MPPLAPTIENALGQTIAYADLMNLLGPLDERPDEDAMIRAHWLAIGHVFDDALLCLGTLQTDRLPEEGRRLMAWCLAGTGDWPQLESMLDSEQTAEACARVWLLQGPLNRFDEGLDLRVELCQGDFQPDNLWWRDTEDQLEATGDWSRLIQLLTEFDDTHLPEFSRLERRSRGIRGVRLNSFLPIRPCRWRFSGWARAHVRRLTLRLSPSWRLTRGASLRATGAGRTHSDGACCARSSASAGHP